jgi:hypothetical protein
LEDEPFRSSDRLCAALSEIRAALKASPDSERLGRLFLNLEEYFNTKANAHAEAGFELGVEVGRRMAGGSQ